METDNICSEVATVHFVSFRLAWAIWKIMRDETKANNSAQEIKRNSFYSFDCIHTFLPTFHTEIHLLQQHMHTDQLNFKY